MFAYFLIDKALIPGILAFTAVRGIFSLFATTSRWSLLLGSILGPALVLIILLRSDRPQIVKPSWQSTIGIFFSFAAPFFFDYSTTPQNAAMACLVFAATLFYFGFGISGYFTLGRNLGVVPSRKNLVSGGVYSVVRHPIYSSYILSTLTLLAVYTTTRNSLAFIVFIAGLSLRIYWEEELLSNDPAYKNYMSQVSQRVFAFPLIIPILPILALRVHGMIFTDPPPRSVIVQTAFPVLSLNPLEYDDWASVFVGNHIYPRLFPETDREWIPSIAKEVRYQCLDLIRSPAHPCKKERLLLNFQEFVTCQGKTLDRNTLKNELLKTLRSKSWIAPGVHTCQSTGTDLCLEYQGIDDITKRLQNVYFRFGWSSQDYSNDILGVAPYCFKVTEKKAGAILSGSLIPVQTGTLPNIQIITSSSTLNEFNVALFGGSQLLLGSRQNIDLITPLAYYVVSNPRFVLQTRERS